MRWWDVRCHGNSLLSDVWPSLSGPPVCTVKDCLPPSLWLSNYCWLVSLPHSLHFVSDASNNNILRDSIWRKTVQMNYCYVRQKTGEGRGFLSVFVQHGNSLSLSLCFEFCDDNILFPWGVAAELSLVLSPKQTVRCLHFLLAYCDEIAALLERERESPALCIKMPATYRIRLTDR